jgi:hypothetical protein
MARSRIMRKIGNFLFKLMFLWLLPSIAVEGAGNEYYKYFRTDSAYVYSWNDVNSSWVPSSVQKYGYDQGKITNLLTLDYATRAEQSKTEYFYNQDWQLETEVNYYFNDGWKEATRNVYYYDLHGRVSEIHIQKLAGSVWGNNRIQMNYVYDENNQQIEFQSIYWRNNAWTLPTTDYSYYDEDGNLIRREAIYPTGATDYQIIYSYDQVDLLAEVYSQFPSGSGWQKWWLINYQYSLCGLKISQVHYTGSGPDWKPSTKVESFSYFKPALCQEANVPVCHNGTTIYMAPKVVQRHLNHGDCIGTCPAGATKSAKTDEPGPIQPENVPFVLYPNPATDQINIVQKNTPKSISRITLTDLNGNIKKAIDNPGDDNIAIEREGLISGQYILTIYAQEMYSLIVVFN